MRDLLYRDYRSILDFVSGRLLFEGPKLLQAFEHLDRFVGRYFSSDEARKIVQYSNDFLGGAPSNTPALYHIMSHIDLTLGVFYPEGGIRAVVDAVRGLAEEHGVAFRFDEPATRIVTENGRAVAVETAQGSYPADVVLVNADYAHAELSLLDEASRTYDGEYWAKRVLAPSAMVLYLYGSAEVIGLMMARLLGLSPACYGAARHLGRGMQYINFIRDIAEDAEMGRTYMPEEELDRFDLASLDEDYLRRRPARFREFVGAQCDLYRSWQSLGETGYRFILWRVRLPIITASDMYGWTAR